MKLESFSLKSIGADFAFGRSVSTVFFWIEQQLTGQIKLPNSFGWLKLPIKPDKTKTLKMRIANESG